MDLTLFVERLLVEANPECPDQQIKSLLMDEHLLKVVSTTCLQSALLKHGYLLFETLGGPSGAHAPLGFVTCVCLLQPSPDNIRLLAQELQKPRFGHYRVVFSASPHTLTLRELADMDTHCLIQSVEEVPLQFLPLEPNVFTRLNWLSSEGGMGAKADPTAHAAQCLASVLKSLSWQRPAIVHLKSSEAAQRVSQALTRALPDENPMMGSLNGSRDEGVVLILDRDADLVTPLLSRWTYQAMIHELLGIQRNVVKLEDASGAGKPPEQIILSSKYDDFFLNNMFKNFGEIGEVVKKLVKEFQEKVSGHKNIESIGDIKDFIVSYPQFKKISGTVSKHVNVISELSRLVSARNLLNISEIEQTLSCHAPTNNSTATFRKLMLDSDLADSVQGLKICHGRTSKHLGFRQSDASHTKVKMDDNLYTQHKPALFWLTESVLQGRLSDELAGDVRGLRPTKKILVYMVGGITYEETLKMYQLNVTYNSNVVIGGCTLWRSKEFCQHLKTISTP
ncbi:LOW QUALITY PROTEIN: vacuolar protein sorting-associated protein 45-like [Tigriopus californicus]|uniref:LOW QUALITY PROTEIN: vacuolar protein sorting-associated protein 45-like n=1 Tax=Tigriopus californicus TaxID=6832 RepID=UPI0027DAB034|nr:LOW QUALITY PROTEIN: vacuolar protein sorting-associated protein 45-like [Tigriopus californicus]